MTDGDLLKLMRRIYSNLDMVCQVGARHQDPHEDQARDYNRNLQRLIEAGLDMEEWLIPESLIKPSYGRIELPDGRLVQLKRVTAEEFFRRANPAMQYLADEISDRSRVQAGRTPVTTDSPVDSPDIWVIFGHDHAFKEEIFDLLTQVGLHPIDFKLAVRRTGSGSPHNLEVVIKAIQSAPAVVALWSPDETVALREELRREPKDKPEHIQAGYQPRPNVLIETGMALAVKRDRTIVVQAGDIRDPTDTVGINYVTWSNDPTKNSEARHDLVHRLEALDCPVDTKRSPAWMTRRRQPSD